MVRVWTVQSCPLLRRRSHPVIVTVLQISQAAVRQLVLSSPSLLKCRPAGVVERVRCLQQLTGLDTPQVVGLLSRSLVLATTSVARLVDR